MHNSMYCIFYFYDVAELTFAGRNEVVYSKALFSPVLRASISRSKHTQ